MSDAPAILTAKTSAEILAAVAMACWQKDHDGADCPHDMIPTETDLIEWLPDCRAESLEEAQRLLSFVLWGQVQTIVQEKTGSGNAGLSLNDELWSWHVLTFRRSDPKLVASLVGIETLGAHDWPLDQVHSLWADLPRNEQPRHPLAPLVRAWQENAPIHTAPDTRAAGILPAPFAVRIPPAVIVRPFHPAPDVPATSSLIPPALDGELWFPDIATHEQNGIPALMLALLGAGTDVQPGRGAPLRDRAFVEALMLAPRQNRQGVRIVAAGSVQTVCEWFGWDVASYRPGRDDKGGALKRALHAASAIIVPLSGGGFVRPVVFNALESLHLDGRIFATLTLPPGSEHGPRANRAVLRTIGKQSAVGWRLYLALVHEWDKISRNGRAPHLTRPAYQRDQAGYLLDAEGHVLTDRRNRPQRNPYGDKRVVETGEREPNPKGEALHRLYNSASELARLIWPFVRAERKNPMRYQRQAIVAAKHLAAMNGCRIETMGMETRVNPHAFPWRIVPPWTR